MDAQPFHKITQSLVLNLGLALEGILENKVRSALTALGIVFGVASVIAMMGIGEGARAEIENQIKLVGVNNIVVSPIIPKIEKDNENKKPAVKSEFSAGLSLNDLTGLKDVISSINQISPEIQLTIDISYNAIKGESKLIGVLPAYFNVFNIPLQEGSMFSSGQTQAGLPVCIINQFIKAKFFPYENPIGKSIKVGVHWLTVIGISKDLTFGTSAKNKEQASNYSIYCPIQTFLLRFENRQLIKESDLIKAAIRNRGIKLGGTPEEASGTTQRNYHQLDRVVIQVKNTKALNPTAKLLQRLLKRKHQGTSDFDVKVPELLLKQQQRSTDIFNYVLGAIAGISLLVGGIGIMNIMLASVLERIKEIGIRLALGARKFDITMQFLLESVIICVLAGAVGILLGIVLNLTVTEIAHIPTVVNISSILISFAVATCIGLLFGVAPAIKAAKQNPIMSLRNE